MIILLTKNDNNSWKKTKTSFKNYVKLVLKTRKSKLVLRSGNTTFTKIQKSGINIFRTRNIFLQKKHETSNNIIKIGNKIEQNGYNDFFLLISL